MNFSTSTHKRSWLFEDENLKQKYAQAQKDAVHTLEAQRGPEGAAPDRKKPRGDSPISLQEETQLRLYYQVKLKDICGQQMLPSKVLSAALVFFKRFYTQASCLEHDPLRVMPTCIYLACKVEESYRSAEGLCKLLGLDAGLVLRFEVPLLQGLGFDLVVHSPYRALAGLFQEFDQLRSQQSPALDSGLISASAQVLTTAHTKARAALDVLMLTDAPLLYPPGTLATAALRSGFRSVNISCQLLLKHIACKAAAVTAAGGTAAAAAVNNAASVSAADGEQHHQQLLALLAAIDQMAAEQGHVDGEELKAKATEIDRKVKIWKKSLATAAAAAAAGGGGAGGSQGGSTPPAPATVVVG